MKAVTAIFNIAIEDEVLEAVRRVGVKHFTQWPRIVGDGPATGPRMDDHVWPGANAALQMIVEDSLAERLMDTLQALRDSPVGRQAGVYAYQSPVERALT
jgi:nitrogen regulatory protein PII